MDGPYFFLVSQIIALVLNLLAVADVVHHIDLQRDSVFLAREILLRLWSAPTMKQKRLVQFGGKAL